MTNRIDISRVVFKSYVIFVAENYENSSQDKFWGQMSPK